MEFVEGQTLRTKVAGGTLKLDDAIAYAIQIGEALHEAHSKGIVHRDIKCENIMVNARNQIKVMDFGLAKLKGSLKLTKASSTVGTLSYMAPEQIQGGEIDGRSDIFSFGVVLFETLTGKMPFRGEHDAAVMYSILNEEPEPLTKYLPEAGSELLHILNRALEKDPGDRYQNVNDMIIDLRRTRKDTGKISRRTLTGIPVQQTLPVEHQTTQTRTVTSSGRTRKIMLGLAAVAVLGAGLWIFVLRPSAKMELSPNMTFRTLQVPFQEIGFPSLSRDGGWVAFAGNARGTAWDVYLMNTGSGEPRQITTDSVGFMQDVDLSPDGSQIVYDRADKGFTKPEIALVSSLGGYSKRIVNIGYNPKWRPDGQRVAYLQNAQWGSKSGKNEFRSIKPNGTDDRLEFSDSLQATGLYSWSPDGLEICWTRRSPEGHFEIFVHNLESGKERQLTSFKKIVVFVSWTQNNEIVFSSNLNGSDNLWMVPASGGTPVQITRGSGPDLGPVVSADLKRLLYVQEQSIGKIWLSSLQGNDAQQLTFDDVNIADPSFSHDGRKVLYVVHTPAPSGSTSAIFILDLQSRQKTQLISEETNIHSPVWSPDGKWIVYAAHPDTLAHDSSKTYVIDAENQGSARQIGMGLPSIWIDNKSFLTTNLMGTWICTIDGAPIKRFFRDSTYAQPVLDGRYILYSDVIPSRRPGMWIEPVSSSGKPDSQAKEVIKSLGSVQYEPNTRSVYYTSPQNDLRRVFLPDGKEEIIRGTFPNLRLGYSFSISADGKNITYLDSKNVRKLIMIENFH
jgi:Tol biopolymer transport system component